ncbi:MAG: winged helix-turn-helix domain-containing protein [Rubricoccaceae bacterium]|nr:winged helix-turn-helix domain-containing protein [Rubricoccaceae bacterium]
MHGDSQPFSDLDTGFDLAGWTVVPRANELVRPGETVHVEPKPMEVLLHLARHAGETVPREALMEAVWPGVYVTEHALNRCVSQLRKLFDDDPRAPSVIETIPKAGYRLIAPVERPGDRDGAALEHLDLRVAVPETAPAPAPRWERRPWVRGLGALAVGALLVLGVVWLRPSAPPPATRALTVAPGVEMQARLSPDGRLVAYVHGAPEGGPRRILVRALDDDAPRALTDGPRDFSPAWSPDGQSLAFTRCDTLPCAVYTVPALGGPARRVASGVAGWGLAWHPDGRRLAAAGRDTTAATPTSRIVLLDLDTGAQTPVSEPPDGTNDIDPVVSPDGAWVAFARTTPNGGDLWRTPTAGGTAERLTFDDRPLASHAFTPDGRHLIFSSARSGVYALWRVPVGGGAVEPVVGPAVRDPGGPALADGRLVVSDWVFEINLWRSVEGGEAERVVASTLWDKQPALSPDGERLAFVSNRTGPPELWTATAEGDGLLRLTDFGGPAVEHPRFSPDGRLIAFEARGEGPADVWVVDAEGGAPRRLTEHPARDVNPRFSRDGRHVLFGSDRGGRWQVWRVPVEGGRPEPVADGIAAEETADGALLVARHGEAGLWRVEDGEARPLSAVPQAGDWASWAGTAAGVLALDRAAGRLVRVDARTGRSEALGPDLGTLMQGEGTVAASADGRTVVWARVDRVEADLLLVEPFE